MVFQGGNLSRASFWNGHYSRLPRNSRAAQINRTMSQNITKKMSTAEKMMLLEWLMYDIRANWHGPKQRLKDKRVWKCLELIDQLYRIATNREHADHNLVRNISWHKFYERIGLYLTGRFEGRILRESISNGGYEGLEQIHGRNPAHSCCSLEYRKTFKSLIKSDYTHIVE